MRNMEHRVAALERRVAQMEAIERCTNCGGPVPYAFSRIPFAQVHEDGRVEILDPVCGECGQLVDAAGRGTGKPSRTGRTVKEMVVFRADAGSETVKAD